MNVQTFILGELALTDSLAEGMVPVERWTERPPGMNSAAYNLWHLARGEDFVINAMVREREQLYHADGWEQKVGLESSEIGIDFTSDEVDRLNQQVDVEGLAGYWRAVRASVRDWIASMPDAELSRVPDSDSRFAALPPVVRSATYLYDVFRGRPVSFYIQWNSLFHANMHIGELAAIGSALP